MAQKLPCEGNKTTTGCKETFEVYGEIPPCGSIDNPDFDKCPHLTVRLAPENAGAWEVYRRTCNQHRMGQAGPVALDLVPVFEVMDRMGIDKSEQIAMADIVTRAYHAVLSEIVT